MITQIWFSRPHDWKRVQIFQRLPAAYQIGPVQNVSGSGRHFVHIQMNHVSVQKINIGCQLLVGIGGGVGFAQQQVYQVCYMLVLVRNFEREVAYKAFRVAHDAAGQVVQKIRFSAVGPPVSVGWKTRSVKGP